MDIVMINALLHSLFTIFSTMVRLKIQPGIPSMKEDSLAKGDVSALIAMNADGVHGSVALSLPLSVVSVISRGMLDQEISSVGNDALDLAGELTNMLVGGAKRILAEKGHDFDMHTPQLLMGEGHEIVHLHAGRTVLFPVNIGEDEFYIELNFV
ncbi:MAG: chemotaxis protein CheX [Sulfuricella sp.]|nr:chemotaxis protein CheX [Sulfuricella sp.]